MSSYWKVDDTMRIGQTYISIPSENGLNYNPEQKIQIFVDPSTKFMNGKESYLEFNLKLKMPATSVPTKLQLDQMGASCLLKSIRIYDGSRGKLLEEIDSYSSLCSVRYDYDTDESTRNYRGLREGHGVHNVGNRGTRGTSHSLMANTLTNPYFKDVSGNQTLATTPWTDDAFLKAKVCIPLHTGIFAQNEHIFPIMMTNGLYIELDTAPANEVIKQLDSVLRHRRVPLNPYFHSIDGANTSTSMWPVDGTARDTFYVSNRNNLSGTDVVSKFPFCVGETFKFVDPTDIDAISTMSGVLKIKEINYDAGTNLIQIVLETARTNTGFVIDPNDFVMYSTAVEEAVTYNPSYEISNVNLVVSQVHLDPDYERGMVQKVREGKNIEIDILTATNYKNSILASDRQTTFQVFAQNSRAKSLLIIPQDASVYSGVQAVSGKDTYEILQNGDADDGALFSNRSGYTGICDELKEISYQIGGRMVPSRAIDVSKIASRKSIDAFHLYEIEKCLDNCGIVPRSFRAYKDNFVFGRGFGVNQGALDLRGLDLAVILKYTGTGVPQKPKLFNSFVFSVRRLLLSSGNIEVIP